MAVEAGRPASMRNHLWISLLRFPADILLFRPLNSKQPRRGGTWQGPDLPLVPLKGTVDCDCLVVVGGLMLHAVRRYADLNPDAAMVLVYAGRTGNNAAGRCMGF